MINNDIELDYILKFFRMKREESFNKLGQLLRMLDSQIILDHGRTLRMGEDAKSPKKPGTSRKRPGA